jgi:hypothetical protein
VEINFDNVKKGAFSFTFWQINTRERISFKIRVLQRIFQPRGDEVTEECSRLHNEELRALYSSLYIIRVSK